MSELYTPAPWDADWFAKVLRDMHNQPFADYLADEQREGFNYPGWTFSCGQDALLIAAAPTLLEALENLIEQAELAMRVEGGEGMWAVDDARAVINSAKGLSA